jgi:hypothetical protein
MKANALLLFLAVLAGVAAPVMADETQTGRIHYEFDLASGKTLALNMRSAEVVIEGSESQKFTIRFEGEKADRAGEIKVTYKDKGDTVECGIKDGPRNDLRIVIGVPQLTNLVIRMPAGVLEISEVKGSKDVKMRAGDLNIDIDDADEYASIDASVTTGEIDVSALGAETGGFFRKFHRSGPGTFRLLAHIGAGQLTIQ